MEDKNRTIQTEALPECVIWDWNGTILDDVGISLACVNDMLIKRNKKAITVAQYREYVDSPISKFYEHIFDSGEISFDTIAEEYNSSYRKYSYMLNLAEGVGDTLAQLNGLGVRQIIISATHRSYIESLTKQFGIDAFFDSVIAADDYEAGSKIERAVSFFEKSGIVPDNCLVIGDSRHDLDMAKALNTHAILVLYGHEGYEKLKDCRVPLTKSLSVGIIKKLYSEVKNVV